MERPHEKYLAPAIPKRGAENHNFIFIRRCKRCVNLGSSFAVSSSIGRKKKVGRKQNRGEEGKRRKKREKKTEEK